MNAVERSLFRTPLSKSKNKETNPPFQSSERASKINALYLMANLSVCSREVAARSGKGRELRQRAGSALPKCLCSTNGRKLGIFLSCLHNPRFWTCRGMSLTLAVCWAESMCRQQQQEAACYSAVPKQAVIDKEPLQEHRA